MKKLFIQNLKESDLVADVFLVVNKKLLVAKTGNQYLTLTLADKTGQIEAKIWENASEISERFEKDDFVQVQARVQKYQEKFQLVISEISKFPEDKVDISDFLPTTKHNIDAMLLEVKKICLSIKNKFLKQLAADFLDDEEFINKFSQAPAAKGMHHVYLGGLLEHTLSIMKLAKSVAPNYAYINEDILICSAFLHDIGKIDELLYKRTFDYTDNGRLLGHIVMGVEMLEQKMSSISQFPDDLKSVLKHLMISHHGYFEFGSPKKPMTLEAIMLHYLDDLDAKMQGMHEYIKNQTQEKSNWTPYHRLMERNMFFKEFDKYEKMKKQDNKESPQQELPLFDGVDN